MPKDHKIAIRIYLTGVAAMAAAFLFYSNLFHTLVRDDTYWDDALVAALVGSVVIGFLYQRELRRRQVEEQRLRTFKATMVTLQDLMGNFLNNIQLIRSESFCLPQDTRDLFDHVMEEIKAHLKALSDVEVLEEKQMAIGTGIQYPAPQVRVPDREQTPAPRIQ